MGNCFGSQAANNNSSSQENPSSNVSRSDVWRHSSARQGTLHAFSYGDMRVATRNFRNEGKLGEGGFGEVFKGYLDEQTLLPVKPGQGMVVAIKKLNLEGVQGPREWVTEVNFLGALDHPNVVKLIGFCAEESNWLLVYEYMSRGSLENHLFHSRIGNQALSWAIRMNIAVGAARGLAFLHDAERRVIYRDLKASNILLDDQYSAKLSDFGLAKNGPTGDNTHVSTRVMGTHGYAAPEYLATGRLTSRSDVYSFGVVLLELLTGRRAIDVHRPHTQQNLVEWARRSLRKRKVLDIVDPRLEGQFSYKGARRAADLALLCLNKDAMARPTMKEIVDSLEPLLNWTRISNG